MKTLLTTLTLASAVFSTSVFANDTDVSSQLSAEQTAAAFVKQQNAAVSKAVELQVNQDIQFALRSHFPRFNFDKTMIAKHAASPQKNKDSE